MAIMPQENNNQGPTFGQAFQSGLKEQWLDPLAQMRAAKLQLALESAATKNRIMAEAQAKQIPQGEFGQIAQGLGGLAQGLLGPNAKLPNFQGITSPQGQEAALGGLKAVTEGAVRMPGLSFLPQRDANGNMNFIPVNKRSGQVGAPISGGFTPQASDKIAQARQGFGEMSSIINRVDNLVSPLITAQTGTMLPEQAANMKIQKLLQNTPNAKVYTDQLGADATRFEYLVTHNGRAPKELVDKAISAFPNPSNDTVASYKMKMDQLKQLASGIKTSTYQSYGLPADFDEQQQGNGQQAPGQAPAVSQAAKDYVAHLGLNLGQ